MLLAGCRLEGQKEDALGCPAGLPSRLPEKLALAEETRQLPSAATELHPILQLLGGLHVSVTSPNS